MDAASKANFINAVAGGQKIPCPNCNTVNDSGSEFCMNCGAELVKKENPETLVTETEFVEPEIEGVEETVSAFAEGLPSWDLVPPQVMVRRKR